VLRRILDSLSAVLDPASLVTSIHLLLYFFSSNLFRYPSLPARISGLIPVRSPGSRTPRFLVKLSALIWLLTLHVGFNVVAILRLIRLHLNVQKSTQQWPSESPPERQPLFPSTVLLLQSIRSGSGAGASMCPLCRNPPRSPACPPCGHVSCWSCLLEVSRRGEPRCVVCRVPFKVQRIRALYNF
jgi:hypothetical protein